MDDEGSTPEADELARALAVWFEELEEQLDEAGPAQPWVREAIAPVFGQPPTTRLPLVDARNVAAAVYDATGARLAATRAFLAAGFEDLVDRDLVAPFAAGGEPGFRKVVHPLDGEGVCLIALAPGPVTATWRLPPAIHEVAQSDRPTAVVLTTVIDRDAEPLRDACLAYGLTGLQTRVALETIRTGAIKPAARNLGLSYQTAREALSAAMRRVGAERLAGLVSRLTSLAFGVFPASAASRDVLADVWGLTDRQIAVAGMFAEGASRERVAQVLGLSLPLVKKELDAAYSLLNVASAAGLARRIVESRAMGWLTAATAGGVGYVEDQSEPLRFVLREDGRRIAYSDYGPASGEPVLVLHSSMTTRIVSRKLLRALQRAGYRPISIDRPGFGLSDPLADGGAWRDPFVAATADVERVLRHLKIRRVNIVSRGAAQHLVALAAAMPEAIGDVVLVNPGPPYRFSGRSIGPLGAIKEAFVRNPQTIRPVASFLASQLTFTRLSKMMVQWTRGSAPDHAAAQDPEIVVDFFRSVRMFATGRFEGFLGEQAAISRLGRPGAFNGGASWRVLLGASDVLYEPEVVLDYWRHQLPGADFQVVEDGGRFLAMTHPQLVVRSLASARH